MEVRTLINFLITTPHTPHPIPKSPINNRFAVILVPFRHEVYLQSKYGRLREAIMGPDGELYVTTSNCDGQSPRPSQQDKILWVSK